MTISKLFWGVSLIVLGLGFLLHNFNLVPEGLFSLWPLIVIMTICSLLAIASLSLVAGRRVPAPSN